MPVWLDTNIVCYALDPAHPEHKKLTELLKAGSKTLGLGILKFVKDGP
jgi:predicted nucleic acid-binding protein